MQKKKTLVELHEIFKSNVAGFPVLLEAIAEELGVSTISLSALEIGLNPQNQSWVFPERNEKGDIIGLCQRLLNGKKLMVKGSKRGLAYVVNQEQTGEQYVSGKHNWQRVSKDIPCPLCGKSDGCLLPAGDTTNPAAVVCVHISEGSIKTLELGHLHILDSKRNTRYSKGGILQRSDYPVIVAEGASDAAAAMDLGFVAIGRPSAEGKLDILRGLLYGREVIVVGDNDAGAGKKGMEAAFKTLEPICKSVTKILPPDGVKDLRNWKNTYNLTRDEFFTYVKQTGQNSENPDIFEDDIAQTIAKIWLAKEETVDGSLTLRNYQGQWVHYVNYAYENMDTVDFRGQLYKFLEDKMYCKAGTRGETTIEPYKPTRAKINDIIDALSQWCPVVGEAPLWLSNKDKRPNPIDLIAFKNGILDVQKYIQGEVCLYNNTPELFTFDVLPYDFDEDLNSKTWNDFLGDIYSDDKDKIKLLSQWFGYNCVPDLSFEKLMLFTGRPRSGKSTVLEAMQAMLGERQCCETSFQSLAGAFGYQPLLGKYAALIGDAKSPRSGEASAVLEKILQITGGDAVSVNRKGIQELPMVHLKCRFTIAMNDLPTFTDHAQALEPRLNILLFENSYVGREDRTLKRRLKKEAQEGKLINFALQGLKDLRTKKDFISPLSSLATLKQFRGLATPIITFVDECCEFEPSNSIDAYSVCKNQLYEVWRNWCAKQGRKPGLKEQFGRWFTAACPQVTTNRARVNGRRQYTFNGVRLAQWVFQEYITG